MITPPRRRTPRLMRALAAVLLLSLVGGCSQPGGVVEEAIEAARDGDRPGFLACFTPRSRALLEAIWLEAGDDFADRFVLGARNARVVAVEGMPPGVGGEVRAKVTVKEGAQTMRLVVHDWAGDWRIDLVDTDRALGGFSMPIGP